METLYNSTRWHLIGESGLDRFMYEDGGILILDTVPITKDSSFEQEFDLRIIYNAIVSENGDYIIEEDSALGNNYIMVEDDYGISQSITEVEFDLYDTVGWHVIAEDGSHVVHEDNTRLLIEYGQVQDPVGEIEFNLYDTTGWHFLAEDGFTHLRYEDGTRPVTEESHVKDLTVGIEKNYYVRSGQHTLMEDGYHYLFEDESFPQLEEGYFKYTVGELEFSLIDSIRGGFQTEDGLDFIAGEGESWLASKLISEQPPITKTPVIIHDPLISPTGRLTMEDLEVTLLAFEDSELNIKSYFLEEGKFEHKMVMTDVSGGDKRFTLTAGTGQHIGMEDGYHYLYEDETIPRLEEDYFKRTFNNIQETDITLTDESVGYHIRCENDDHIIWEHATEGSEFDNSISRMISEEDHVKSSTRQIIMDLGGEILAFEDGTGHFITEGSTPNRILVTPQADASPQSGQSSFMAPSILAGGISIAANSVTAEGIGTSFTTQLSVGDVFQTSDENVILEDSEDTLILETLEVIAHEDITIAEVQNHVILGIEAYIVNTWKWYIGNENSAQSAHEFTPNVLGSYVINREVEQYNFLDETTDFGKYVGLEDDSGVLRIELSEFSTGVAVLLETGDKIVHTEKGEFKVAAITDDDTLTVTRKHWEGTDYVPCWKQTTEVETTAVVAYK